MNKKNFLSHLIGLGLCLGAGSVVASDIVNVRIVNAQGEQSVDIDLDALKVGESRQLAAASGAPAIVSRNEAGLRVEINGRSTEVKLSAPGQHPVHEAGTEHRVRFVHKDHAHTDAQGTEREVRKVVVMRKGEHGEIDAAKLEALAAEARVDFDMRIDTQSLQGDEERVFVTRKILREDRSN